MTFILKNFFLLRLHKIQVFLYQHIDRFSTIFIPSIMMIIKNQNIESRDIKKSSSTNPTRSKCASATLAGQRQSHSESAVTSRSNCNCNSWTMSGPTIALDANGSMCPNNQFACHSDDTDSANRDRALGPIYNDGPYKLTWEFTIDEQWSNCMSKYCERFTFIRINEFAKIWKQSRNEFIDYSIT